VTSTKQVCYRPAPHFKIVDLRYLAFERLRFSDAAVESFAPTAYYGVQLAGGIKSASQPIEPPLLLVLGVGLMRTFDQDLPI